MPKTLFIIARQFTSNSGSYAGVFEEFSKYAYSQKYKVKILCAQTKKEHPLSEKLPYAEVIRFPIPSLKIPFLGMNNDYIFLGKQIKKYFDKNKPDLEDVFIANGRAALGILNQRYNLRMGQPANIFLKNMETANSEVTIITKIARKIHFSFQFFLEKKCVKNAKGYITPSKETLDLIMKEYDKRAKSSFVPQSGVRFNELQKGEKALKGKFLLFVSAGEEKVRKGVVYLEKALPEIFSKYPDARLLHVGDKFEWNVPETCKQKIVSVGRVPWDKMKDYYASSEILLSCAINEGMANSIFEAMATGTPVLSSDINGINEYLSHKKDSYIYKKSDISDLKKGVDFLLTTKNFKKKASVLLKAKATNLSYDIFSEKLIYFISQSKKNKVNFNLLKND